MAGIEIKSKKGTLKDGRKAQFVLIETQNHQKLLSALHLICASLATQLCWVLSLRERCAQGFSWFVVGLLFLQLSHSIRWAVEADGA